MKPSNFEISKLTLRMMYLGLAIDLGGPLAAFVAGTTLAQAGVVTAAEAELKVLGYILLAVSVVELAVVMVLKRRWLQTRNPLLVAAKRFRDFVRRLTGFYVTLYFVALSPAIYGFLYFMLGGTQDMFILMCSLTLLGYLLIRPRPSHLEALLEPFEFDSL